MKKLMLVTVFMFMANLSFSQPSDPGDPDNPTKDKEKNQPAKEKNQTKLIKYHIWYFAWLFYKASKNNSKY